MKIASLIIMLLLLPVASPSLAAQPSSPRCAVALLPTPVLNSADFAGVFGGPDGRTLRLDPSGLVREVEFVAFPGTTFRVEETLKLHGIDVYRVTTEEYPYPTTTGYFIDSRFVKLAEPPPPSRPRRLPSRQQVIDNLLAARGSRYVWGGNYRAGIPQLLSFYPPAGGASLAPALSDLWQLRGVDCSGLLYEATGGFTPRNTSSLMAYGQPVPIKGLDAGEIIRRMEPLDLIVWPGHVMVVIDGGRIIESRLDRKGKKGGVGVRPLRSALDELIRSRVPLNDLSGRTCIGVKGFVVRRWYDRAVSAPPSPVPSGPR